MLIELKDGGLINYKSATEYSTGCDTCDYGSAYTNYFSLIMKKGDIDFEVAQEYDFAISEDYMMKLLLQNIDVIKSFTEVEFYWWLKEKLEKDFIDEVDNFTIETTIKLNPEEGYGFNDF